jgi:hypothetical protein
MTRQVFLVLLLCWTALAHAQDVGGTIEGRVLDASGVPIAAAEVSASSPDMLGLRTTSTGADGRFYLRALPVGTYRVQVRRIGLRPVALEAVQVWLGQVTEIPPIQLHVVPPVELDAVQVMAADDALDPVRTSTSVVLDRDRLSRLPVSRNFRELAILLPQATPSFFPGDGINIAGATGLENRYFVDGIDITSVGNGGSSLDLPYNFIQQVQLRTGGADASGAAVLGGTVNVVTPTGSNQFRGSAFGFFSGRALQAPGRAVGGATDFSSSDIGVTLSGPLLRDQVWFFAAYNPRLERQTLSYDFGDVSGDSRIHQFAGKITTRLGRNGTSTLTLLGDPREGMNVSPNFTVAPGAIPLSAEPLRLRERGGGYGVSWRVHGQVGRRSVLEASLSRTRTRATGIPVGPREPSFVDLTAGTLSGGRGEEYAYRESRNAAEIRLSSQLGAHHLHAGARFEEATASSRFYFEMISFDGTDYTRLLTDSDAAGVMANRVPVVHLQDTWQLTERLSLTGGARLSKQRILNRSGLSPGFSLRDGLQPRFGFVYHLGALGSQRVFGSFARIAHQIALAGSIDYQTGFTRFSNFPQDPRTDTSGEAVFVEFIRNGVGSPVDGSLRPPSADHWSLGYARRIGTTMTLVLSAEHRRLGEHLESGGNDGNPIWGNPGRGAMSAFPRPTRTHDALHVILERQGDVAGGWKVAYVLSRTHGNFPGLYTTDYRFASPHYGPSFDVTAAWERSTGLLPNDRTHVLRVYGWRDFGAGLAVGASAYAASGTPLSELWTDDAYLFFGRDRGTAGRSPSIYDLTLRASYALPTRFVAGARVLLDVEHVGSARATVDVEQVRYTCAARDSTCLNAGYGRATRFQPPMAARLGFEVDF